MVKRNRESKYHFTNTAKEKRRKDEKKEILRMTARSDMQYEFQYLKCPSRR